MENKKNFYIDGKWVTPKSKEEINVIDPATEAVSYTHLRAHET